MIKRLVAACIIATAIAAIAIEGGMPRTAQASFFTGDSLRSGPLTAADSAHALERLVGDLNAIVATAGGKNSRVGVTVRSLSARRDLFALNEDAPLTPASTTKVVTAFMALTELGPKYTVKTILAADVKPHDGIVKGNLYLKGFGDPYFSINDVDELIDQVVNSGVHQIDGDIVGDGTFFDNKTERIQYSGDKEVVEALPPIMALTFTGNTFTVVISSTRLSGAPLNVQTVPHSSAFEIVNTGLTAAPPPPRRAAKRGRRHSDLLMPETEERYARTADADDEFAPRYGDEPAGAYDRMLFGNRPAKRSSPKASQRPPASRTKIARTAAQKKPSAARAKATASSRRDARKGTTAARSTRGKPTIARSAAPKKAPAAPSKPVASAPAVPARALHVELTTADDGRQVIAVSGTLPPGRTVSYRYQMRNAPLVLAGLIYDRLRSHGVTINGHPVSGTTPAKYKTVAETSRPLTEILSTMLKHSNNFLAEYMFKMVGAAAGGQQETARRTLERLQSRMNASHVPFGRCIINDGSGLSRANCLTTSALAGILEAAYNDKRIFDTFYTSLSIAGVDGTLRRRMRGTYAERNVHGKTGTLNNVSALAGYVTTRDGELLCFSMLMNGSGGYHPVQDRVAARLAAFSYADQPAAPAASPTAK